MDKRRHVDYPNRTARPTVNSSHIPSILPTHVIQRMADLPQAMRLYRFDQRLEYVPPPTRRVLKIRQAVAVVDLGHGFILNHVGMAGLPLRRQRVAVGLLGAD